MKNRVGNKVNPRAWAPAKKIKNRNIISEVFSDYCSHTTLHGIGYLGAKNKTLPEKIWWIAVFITSLTVCIYLITNTWLKWKNNPVVLSIEKEQTPIWTIPFPAVTVCPLNKARQTVYNYTDMFRRRHNLTGDEYKKFWDISLVCTLGYYDQTFESSIEFTDEEALKNIIKIAPRVSNSIYQAQWQNEKGITLFDEHVNKEGLCFTFNSLIKDDKFTTDIEKNVTPFHNDTRSTKWTMEDGYPLDSNLNVYPRRTAQDGSESGISFILFSQTIDIDYVCGFPISGYKVIIHNPVESARAAKRFFLISSDNKATIMIKPELTKTSTSLRYLSPHERQCYFSNEKTLRFFTVYTQNNCRMECDANVTEHYCGCVPFYMPRNKNSLICGFGKMNCLRQIESKFFDFEMIKKGIYISEEMKTKTYKIYSDCDCLPACNNLQFTAEISTSKTQLFQSLAASGLYDGKVTARRQEELLNGVLQINQIDIFFKESEFLALQRSELYGTTDFLANCGGLLGLFLGFSILSLVEITYFLTLRIWCRIRNKN